METRFLILAFFVLAGNMTEAIAGFGSTMFAVIAGAHFYPIHVLLPSLVPLNVLLSLYIVARNSRHIDHKKLWGRIFPLSMLGFPAGIIVFHSVKGDALKTAFGMFVALLSVIELIVISRAKENHKENVKHLTAAQKIFFYAGGGIMQGAYAAGGPMIVYASSREIYDKHVFRSTLSMLWLVMNLFLIASYFISGRYNSETFKMTALLLPALLGGIALGDWLHHSIPEKTFRVFVFALLFSAGLSLVIKG